MYLCTQNYDLKRGGTFETAKAGTFHSVTAGTSIPLFTYKVLLKVAITQDDPDSITFIQLDNDKQLECKIPKNDIIEIYKVVFRISRP